MTNSWSPHTWQRLPYYQRPKYFSDDHYQEVITHLSTQPPLVKIDDIDRLRGHLTQAANNQAFIFQGGDCAESFAECRAENINSKLKMMMQISLVLLANLNKPIISIGRIAGQFAKPRSSSYEAQNGYDLPSYQGDLINQKTFSEAARAPNPTRMLEGYDHAARTMQHLHSWVDHHLNNIRNCQAWLLEHIPSENQTEFWNIASHADKILDSFKNSHIAPPQFPLFTSHEAFLLPYESALTRYHQASNNWYNLATHFPWLGMRTAQPNSAHVEYLKGIANPVAIKIGPKHTPDLVLKILDELNPNFQVGKIMLVHRYGMSFIRSQLPDLITAVRASKHPVAWCCDPMHGNTRLTKHDLKTRYFEDILAELTFALEIHHQHETPLNGLHLEIAADHVTECIGGKNGVTESDLSTVYRSLVDPRLNYNQALEMTHLFSAQLKKYQDLVLCY